MAPLRALLLAVVLGVAPQLAQAQTPPAAQKPAQDEELQALIGKTNAYVDLGNRTLRAMDSWNRYKSWVRDVKVGPTGRERIVYGLYSLYDVRELIEKALAATEAKPALPDLDAAVKRYVAAYSELAPIVAKAEGYYERKDYLADKWAEGKALHAKLAPAALAFVAARADFDRQLDAIKAELDRRELADLEAREGKKARWHVRAVLIEAKRMVELLPTNDKPVVDLPAFDKVLADYAARVKEFDEYASANPNSFFTFESQPRSWLGNLREFRQKITRSKGDARRANVSFEMTWLINSYNSMISSARSATTFAK
jgi:hypothetical protein